MFKDASMKVIRYAKKQLLKQLDQAFQTAIWCLSSLTLEEFCLRELFIGIAVKETGLS